MNKDKLKELLKLFILFFKVGAFTIGGGMAMLPIIRREFVDKHKLVSDERLVDIFAVSQSLPGVIAINTSMYVGYEVAGIPGLIISALGVVMPSFIIILAIAFFLSSIGDNVYLAKFFLGIRCAVVPLILLAAINMGKSALKDVFGFIIAGVSIIATVFFNMDVVFILLAGLAGYIFYTIRNKQKSGV